MTTRPPPLLVIASALAVRKLGAIGNVRVFGYNVALGHCLIGFLEKHLTVPERERKTMRAIYIYIYKGGERGVNAPTLAAPVRCETQG